MRRTPVLLPCVAVLAAACAAGSPERGVGEPVAASTFVLTSDAFRDGAPIPARHSADGEDVSPPLRWSGVPEGAVELALVVDDPDAPTDEPWVHWVAWGIPADATGLPEGVASGLTPGRNDFGRSGWGGPAPPRGHGAHRYRFTLLALDEAPDLPSGATKARLLAAAEGHVLARAALVGTYERP